jgi:CrcB protein
VKGVLWVGLGGFVGAIARYLLATWIAGRAGTAFPLGTLVINLSGSLVLGLLVGVLENHVTPPTLRLALATGFLGAYTTFSTFTYETIRLVEEGSFLLAALNAGGSLALGLGAVFGGLGLGRAL